MRLILLRHGESVWNRRNRFTGWVDVPLSARGIREARQAGALLRDERLDVAFTSRLLRAQHTLWEVLAVNRHCGEYRVLHSDEDPWYERFHRLPGDEQVLPVHVAEQLNERCYGDLQGRDKDAARAEFGTEQVHRWRRGFRDAPPGGESLERTAARVLPYFRAQIEPCLTSGRTVLVCAHGNSLRALIMHLEGLDGEQIVGREVPTGRPILYRLGPSLELLGHEERFSCGQA